MSSLSRSQAVAQASQVFSSGRPDFALRPLSLSEFRLQRVDVEVLVTLSDYRTAYHLTGRKPAKSQIRWEKKNLGSIGPQGGCPDLR